MVAASTPGTAMAAISVILKLRKKSRRISIGENNADEDRVAHALRRGRDQLALVVPVGNLDVRRQLLCETRPAWL